jgi:hypothetical protein
MKEKTAIIFEASMIMVIFSLILIAGINEDIEYNFTQSDSTYIFYGCFNTRANASCVINICFDYEHNCALSTHASEVSLVEQGENWNKIRYTYTAYFVFRTESVWLRTLDTLQKRVDFTLVENRNNSRLMPEIHSSKGYYRVNAQKNGNLLEYYQQFCLTETMLTTQYKNQIKNEAIDFLYLLSDYVNGYCQTNLPEPESYDQ